MYFQVTYKKYRTFSGYLWSWACCLVCGDTCQREISLWWWNSWSVFLSWYNFNLSLFLSLWWWWIFAIFLWDEYLHLNYENFLQWAWNIQLHLTMYLNSVRYRRTLPFSCIYHCTQESEKITMVWVGKRSMF